MSSKDWTCALQSGYGAKATPETALRDCGFFPLHVQAGAQARRLPTAMHCLDVEASMPCTTVSSQLSNQRRCIFPRASVWVWPRSFPFARTRDICSLSLLREQTLHKSGDLVKQLII